MSARIAVYVYGTDLVTQAGVAAQLRGRPETYVVEEHSIDAAVVAVVVVDQVDDQLVKIVRGIQRDGCPRVVLVATTCDQADIAAAIDAGVVGIVRRHEVTPELLAHAVVAASNDRTTLPRDAVRPIAATPLVPPVRPDLGRTARHEAPTTHRTARLSEREVRVLTLLADGFDTQEIAARLAYSERTIKGIIHDVTTRLHLRNRSHAVAYAIKAGVV
ncbi:MAG: response regulator transcription factor [Ilumatobacteraceae bacterium]|nr:response regulator transcription factor [Ilumatobacteraceae bacterium]